MTEWLVEGAHGALWFPARNGDEACEKYVARYRLTPWQHDELVVVNVRHEAPLPTEYGCMGDHDPSDPCHPHVFDGQANG